MKREVKVDHPTYDYYWNYVQKLPARKGTFCRIVNYGRMNSILVEFEADRFRVVTSRYAVRRKKT